MVINCKFLLHIAVKRIGLRVGPFTQCTQELFVQQGLQFFPILLKWICGSKGKWSDV